MRTMHAVPTLHQESGYSFRFFSADRDEPPHVHVDRAEFSLKIWLTPVGLARNHGFRGREINAIIALVEEHRVMLLEAWHEYFGKDR